MERWEKDGAADRAFLSDKHEQTQQAVQVHTSVLLNITAMPLADAAKHQYIEALTAQHLPGMGHTGHSHCCFSAWLTLSPVLVCCVNAAVQLTKLPAHIRPAMLGFGGLADGFMSFDAIPSDTPTSTTPSNPQTPSPPTAAAPPAHTEAALSQTEVTLPVCSLVMKAVQARLPGHLHTNSNSSRPAAADAPAGPTPSQPGTPSATPAAAPAATAVLASLRQASAVKLGDGGLSKAQTDPRLPPDVRQSVLDKMQVSLKMVWKSHEGGFEGRGGVCGTE